MSPLGSPGVFFTKDCLFGGLGCSASGKKCCRFCGAGDFATIKCPTAAVPDSRRKPAAEKVDLDKIAADAIAAAIADKVAATAAAHKLAAEKGDLDKIAADKIAAAIADKVAAHKAAADQVDTYRAALGK